MLNDTVYRVHIIPELGLGVASWSSTQPLDARLRQQLLLWLPIGLFTSLLTSFYFYACCADYALRVMACWMRCNPMPSGLLSADRLAGGWQNRRRRSAGPLAAAGWHFLSPDIFIPLAEQTGLITRLTEDIVRKIFADLGPWLRHHPQMHISINLSVDDLRSPTLPTLLKEQLARWESVRNRSP